VSADAHAVADCDALAVRLGERRRNGHGHAHSDPDADADAHTHSHGGRLGHWLGEPVGVAHADQPGARQLPDRHPHGAAVRLAVGQPEPRHLCVGSANAQRERHGVADREALGDRLPRDLRLRVADGHAGAVAVTHGAAPRGHAVPDALSDAAWSLSLTRKN
jgi:hypothetical protein